MNELIFIIHTITIAGIVLCAQRMGQHALTAIVCLFAILANLFVAKQITLAGYHTITTDALAVGAFLALNLMQEYYGRAATRATIWVSFGCGIVYTGLSLLQLWYIPSDFDSSQIHYQALLAPMPRIMISSLVTYLIAEYIDYGLYGFLKQRAPQFLLLRTTGSLVISQLFDTIIFTYLGLYGTHDNLWDIIVVSYVVKLATIAIATPFVSLSLYLTRSTARSAKNDLTKKLILPDRGELVESIRSHKINSKNK